MMSYRVEDRRYRFSQLLRLCMGVRPGRQLVSAVRRVWFEQELGQRRAAGCAVQLLSSHEHQLQILPSYIRATLFQ